MESMLQTKTVHSETLARDIEIRELSYKAQCAMLDAAQDGRPTDAGPITIQYGVPEFGELSSDEIAESFPAKVVKELSDFVLEFSGLGEEEPKKLESVRTTDSATR